MCFTGLIMLIISAVRLPSYEPGGNVIMGLIIAILGFITNTFFWFRYRALTRQEFNVVIGSQQNLYRAKSFVDLVVVTALLAVAIVPSNPITRYVDIIGSIIVACYLLWTGIRTIRENSNS